MTVACVQAEPVVLDRDATLDKLAALTGEAAGNGAELVVFPETFVSVYPSSAWARATMSMRSTSAGGRCAHMYSRTGCWSCGTSVAVSAPR